MTCVGKIGCEGNSEKCKEGCVCVKEDESEMSRLGSTEAQIRTIAMVLGVFGPVFQSRGFEVAGVGFVLGGAWIGQGNSNYCECQEQQARNQPKDLPDTDVLRGRKFVTLNEGKSTRRQVLSSNSASRDGSL